MYSKAERQKAVGKYIWEEDCYCCCNLYGEEISMEEW